MKKKNKSVVFIVSVVVLIAALLGLLAFLNNHQTTKKMEELPTYDMVEDSVLEINGLNLDRQPMLGDENAPVTVIEFGDFKCPACKLWNQNVFPQLEKEYIDTNKVKFHFINFSFLGEDSLLASIAGESIYKQNEEKFWEYIQLIYDNQGLSTADLWATKSFLMNLIEKNIEGLDYEQIEKDLTEFTYLKEVKEDLYITQKQGISSTPTIMVNDQVVKDSGYESIKVAIELALLQQQQQQEEE